jgi:hypothetical protein
MNCAGVPPQMWTAFERKTLGGLVSDVPVAVIYPVSLPGPTLMTQRCYIRGIEEPAKRARHPAFRTQFRRPKVAKTSGIASCG